MSFQNDYLINLVKQHSASQAQSYNFSRIGWVKDFDPEMNNVKVAYYNAVTREWDLLSGWLPLIMPSLGKGDDSEGGEGKTWGFVHPPNMNEQVVVISQNGDFSNGYVIGALYSTVVPPPDPDGTLTEMGEFLWCHKSGSYIKFNNDGDITIVTDNDLNVKVGRNANVLIKGDATVEADGNVSIFVGGNATVVSDGDITSYSSTLAANVKNDADIAVGGNITADVGGNVHAAIGGSMTADVRGSIDMTSLGMATIKTLAGILMETDGNIIMRAAGAIALDEGATVVPPIPVFIRPVPNPPERPDLTGLFDRGGAGEEGGIPAPPPAEIQIDLGPATGITGLTALNAAPTSFDVQFNGPQ